MQDAPAPMTLGNMRANGVRTLAVNGSDRDFLVFCVGRGG
jgi:hypothetical protein